MPAPVSTTTSPSATNAASSSSRSTGASMPPCCHHEALLSRGSVARSAEGTGRDRMVTTRCAVLLRGVNVGKHNRIAMADFRALLGGLGAADVMTLLQSGNAAVTAEVAGLADRIEAALANDLRLNVRVLVRTGAELD